MDSATADMLQFALAAPLGFYKRADTIVRLLTNDYQRPFWRNSNATRWRRTSRLDQGSP